MSPIRLRSLSNSKLLGYLVFSLVCLMFLVYAAFQARFILIGPQITISDNLSVTQNQQKVIIEGQAKNITAISLNGRPIVTNETGHFSQPLILENGYTIASIVARDRYGREVTLKREFVYTPLSLLKTN